ncbi:hypothetical protein BDF20DRAFT_850314 [Mycotypha africana]|uniref:uncharacterized protein n=1 Tax=Mycotypha africana TaxID=64632 RepID=UPI002300F785|nr:uncharacterized protein BDF20DRAFT_850314 [Mycotypha africana]KAI8987443.1 hypothetical protein BDF20DRAFT_850314 [Mycotypha africana]
MKRILSPVLEPDVTLTSPDADIEYLRRQLATHKRLATATTGLTNLGSLNEKSLTGSATDTTKAKSKKASDAVASTTESNIKNHDLCDACGDVGQFICCDACPNAFHFTCVDPPMSVDDVINMEDTWYCNECLQKRKKNKAVTTGKDSGLGLFQPLIDNMGTKNPKAFRLPNEIINFFEGVSSDKLGRYVDSSQVKRVKYRHGEMERPDYHPLKRNGHYTVCFYCRKTALNKQMISCDYCPLYWHLDCLNPPMPAPPNPAKRWRCPVHIENFIKQPRRQKHKTPTIISDKSPSCAFHNYLENVHIIHHSNEQQPKKFIAAATAAFPMTPSEHLITSSKDNKVYRLPTEPFRVNFDSYARKALKERRLLMNDNLTAAKKQGRKYSLPSTLISSSSGSEICTPPLFASPVSTTAPTVIKSTLPPQPLFNNTDMATTNATASSSNNNTQTEQEEVDLWLQNMALFKTNATDFKAMPTTTESSSTNDTTTQKQPMTMTEDKLLTLLKFSTDATANTMENTSLSPPSSPIPVKHQQQPHPFEPSNRKLRAVNINKFKRYKKFEHLLGQKSEQELINVFKKLL